MHPFLLTYVAGSETAFTLRLDPSETSDLPGTTEFNRNNESFLRWCFFLQGRQNPVGWGWCLGLDFFPWSGRVRGHTSKQHGRAQLWCGFGGSLHFTCQVFSHCYKNVHSRKFLSPTYLFLQASELTF